MTWTSCTRTKRSDRCGERTEINSIQRACGVGWDAAGSEHQQTTRPSPGMHEGAAAPSYANPQRRHVRREERLQAASDIIWSVPAGRARNDVFPVFSIDARMRQQTCIASPSTILCRRTETAPTEGRLFVCPGYAPRNDVIAASSAATERIDCWRASTCRRMCAGACSKSLRALESLSSSAYRLG